MQPDTKTLCVTAAILCARESLPIFEACRPDDIRPRKAIEAAEQWLDDGTVPNTAWLQGAIIARADQFNPIEVGYTQEDAWAAAACAVAAIASVTTRSGDAAVACAMTAYKAAVVVVPGPERVKINEYYREHLRGVM